MSAAVGVYVATALFLAIGGDTEEAMWEHTQWVEDGVSCASMRWLSEQRRLIDNMSCIQQMMPADLRDMERIERDDVFPLHQPEWEISDQPTGYKNKRGYWIKLQL